MIKTYFVAALLVNSALLCSVEAWAATVDGVFNTGVSETGALLQDGASDTHYIVTSTGGKPYVFSNGFYTQASDAKFISYSSEPNGLNPLVTTNYSTTFDLSGYNVTTAVLSGKIGADDYAMIFLNGTQIYASPANTIAYTSLESFSASQYFVSGVNTLQFAVTNAGGPTGFLVSDLKVTALGAPGPVAGASLPALAGLFGLWFMRRNQRPRSA